MPHRQDVHCARNAFMTVALISTVLCLGYGLFGCSDDIPFGCWIWTKDVGAVTRITKNIDFCYSSVSGYFDCYALDATVTYGDNMSCTFEIYNNRRGHDSSTPPSVGTHTMLPFVKNRITGECSPWTSSMHIMTWMSATYFVVACVFYLLWLVTIVRLIFWN